jgi:transglutaminase-like putative cysteine protease
MREKKFEGETMSFRPRLEEGWSTLFLLWAMLFTAAAIVPQTDLTYGLHIVPTVATVAVLMGTLLAKSRFSANTANLFSLVYGLFAVFVLMGTTQDFVGMTWQERILHPTDGIITRQIAWLQKLINGGTSRDGFMFVSHTTMVYWLLGYAAAWYTFRRPRVWRVVVPAGVVLLSIVYYYTGTKALERYLVVYAVLSLLFVARTYLIEREFDWRRTAVRYESTIWFTFLRAGLVAALLALLLAWYLPPLSANASVSNALGGARGPWREFQDNWTRMFSALRTYGATTADPYQDTLVLGGPRTVGNSPVMDIFVAERLPYVYWQAITYDTYNEFGSWEAPNDSFREYFPDDGPISTPFTGSREVITQTVYSYFPNSSLIYGAPEIISVDRAINLYAQPDGNGNDLVSAVRSKFVLQQGDQYNVTSRLSLADATSLRAAGTGYPAWITETYLQLPETVSPETVSLAEELTASFNTPFDKAISVRNYLRDTISYNDQIDAPPDGVDPVHHTLFVTQEGYCNYYASAMAVMLRSQGVPARLVSGYAQGSFDEENSSYRVRASNAHTWVEVYFPGYGWVQFEPTSSIPTVDRPELLNAGDGGDAFGAFVNPLLEREDLLPEDEQGEDDGVLDPNDLLPDDPAADLPVAELGFWETFPVWQAVGATLLVIVAAVLSAVANEMNKRVESDVSRSYDRLSWWARWIGVEARPVDTPYERADMLATAVPAGKEPIRILTKQFVLKQFSRAKAYESNFNPRTVWQTLRPLLLRESIVHQLQRLQRRRDREK